MEFELEYMSRFFQKMSGKPKETYVISRLWHRLNRTDIQMLPQQYVKGIEEKNYAMADVFFPQIKLFVEINEPAHYFSPQKIEIDNVRNEIIKEKTNCNVRIIDCRKSLEDLHKDIEELIIFILDEVEMLKKNNQFKPWRPNEARDPLFWKSNNLIKRSDDIILPRIEDICTLFDADFNKTKRGFLRKGAVAHPQKTDVLIWWPSRYSRSGWENQLLENEEYVTESHVNPEKTSSHYYNTTQYPHKRIIFYFDVDVLGFIGYYFLGIYEIDFHRSNTTNGIYWKRIATEFSLL
jgi:hypothetical protein